MWKPYLKVIAEKAGDAPNIHDRLHIMAQVSKTMDKARATEAKALKFKGKDPILTVSRWSR